MVLQLIALLPVLLHLIHMRIFSFYRTNTFFLQKQFFFSGFNIKGKGLIEINVQIFNKLIDQLTYGCSRR